MRRLGSRSPNLNYYKDVMINNNTTLVQRGKKHVKTSTQKKMHSFKWINLFDIITILCTCLLFFYTFIIFIIQQYKIHLHFFLFFLPKKTDYCFVFLFKLGLQKDVGL